MVNKNTSQYIHNLTERVFDILSNVSPNSIPLDSHLVSPPPAMIAPSTEEAQEGGNFSSNDHQANGEYGEQHQGGRGMQEEEGEDD